MVTMKFLGLFGFLLLVTNTAYSSLLDPVIENVRHIKATHPPDNVSGMWKKKMLWKPRWIKEWKSSNVLKPVWKKFWGPVIIREWVPIPKPPGQWGGLHKNPSGSSIPFVNVPEPPTPNFKYLLNGPSSDSHKPSGAVQEVPHLPISSAYNAHVESYSGQSSYGSSVVDSSAYDLNPPVEPYNPDHNYSGYNSPTPLPPVKPASPFFYFHHYNPTTQHHHHHVKSNIHSLTRNPPDLTKFPPNWNSWQSLPQKPDSHSPGVAQASSAVSVVSEVEKTSPSPLNHVGSDHLHSEVLSSADDQFIQQAALISEFHYTENPLQNVSPINPPFPSSHNVDSFPAKTHSEIPHLGNDSVRNVTHTPQSSVLESSVAFNHHGFNHRPSHSQKSSPPHDLKPFQKLPPAKQNFSQPPSLHPHNGGPFHVLQNKTTPIQTHTTAKRVHPPVRMPPSTVHVQKSTGRQNPKPIPAQIPLGHSNYPPRKPESPKNHPQEKLKRPDFKALPITSASAFHFIEGFPSNETLTKATLIGNLNETGVLERNQVEIIPAHPQQKQISPYVAKLAQAIVSEHLKKAEATKTTETTRVAGVETSTVAIVYPSTNNPFARKTLKAYLEDEGSVENSTKVFVVTPVPQAKVEQSSQL